MATIRRSARVDFCAQEMLALVNDVESYPQFLHWCQDARIEKREGQTVEAALEIGISGIHKTMRTRNRTRESESGDSAGIDIEMLDGPLKHLNGRWHFTDISGNGCEIILELEYETHRTPFGFLLRTLFDEIANSQLNAFVRRAREVYERDR